LRKRTPNGAESYDISELIAELGPALFTIARDLTPEPRPDHVGYIQS